MGQRSCRVDSAWTVSACRPAPRIYATPVASDHCPLRIEPSPRAVSSTSLTELERYTQQTACAGPHHAATAMAPVSNNPRPGLRRLTVAAPQPRHARPERPGPDLRGPPRPQLAPHRSHRRRPASRRPRAPPSPRVRPARARDAARRRAAVRHGARVAARRAPAARARPAPFLDRRQRYRAWR